MANKETYFTADNIAAKAVSMLDKLDLSGGNSFDFNYEPSASALIILDLQHYFLNEVSHAFIPSSIAILDNIKSLIEQYKKKKLPVIFTRHINSRENAGLMSLWWNDIIEEDNHLSQLLQGLADNNDLVINKTQYDAFYNTHLETILKERNISQLVITGVMTHLCCETTVRSAFVRGFKVFFPVDATATYNEKYHQSTLNNLSHGFTSPLLVSKIVSRLEEN